MIKALSPEQLRKSVNPASFDWKSIEENHSSKPLIGQNRALKALEFGLGNKSHGFNIYVSGYPGSGKLNAVQHFLKERVKKESPPGDWCYVYNFSDPYHPKKISLPQGGAKIFKEDVAQFIQEARKNLIKAFDSEEYANKRELILNELQKREDAQLDEISKKAKVENFVIKRTPVEVIAVPLNQEGKPITEKEFEALNEEDQKRLLEKQNNFKDELISVLRKTRDSEREGRQNLMQLEKQVALYAINTLVEELKEKYREQADVLNHLEDLKNDILIHLEEFMKSPDGGKTSLFNMNEGPTAGLKKYKVNVFVDNSHLEGAPFIVELNPTYNNLFGRVEYMSHMGTLSTDFSLIRSGSLHASNGGYLVIPVEELLRNYFSWDSLKRALRNSEVLIEDAGERLGFISTKSLKPDPIPLNLQIILIGNPRLYYLLYELDDDFKELFKVKAEFDATMQANERNIAEFLSVIARICRKDGLLSLDKSASAKIIEYAARLAEDQEKLSTRFSDIIDIVREANYYALQEVSKFIQGKHITKAIEEKYYRSNLLQEKINELIFKGVLIIDLEGSKMGQVNGISVIDLGDVSFGRPNRITASVSLGKEGVVDIEREAELGGPIHTKGVLILSGYLAEKYAEDHPINIEARLVFEQSYGEIEGDSASSAELYALLSNLADLPIQQGIAVTGSVNQKGEIQAVGGINEKIEGYFKVCQQKGLKGVQGVIIPTGNLKQLMLREELVQAVEEQKFNVWAVSTVDQGMEILTGVKGGVQLEDGTYKAGTVHDRVSKTIKEFSHKFEKFRKSNT